MNAKSHGHAAGEGYALHCGDCLEVLATLTANSIDSIVCDPPYGLSFMGKAWDHGVPGAPFWEAALRVAKPGAMLLAFGGTRTHHRLMCAIEDAGWEIRDCLMWLYGQGFPKGNSQLKPAWEPIIMARKPLIGTVAENALAHGCGVLNVDGCRIEANGQQKHATPAVGTLGQNGIYGSANEVLNSKQVARAEQGLNPRYDPQGRWPANLMLDEEAAAMLDGQSGERGNNWRKNKSHGSQTDGGYSGGWGSVPRNDYMSDTGGASRFFYVAKASKRDRDEGLEGMEMQSAYTHNIDGRDASKPTNAMGGGERKRVERGAPGIEPKRNHHPTVKPTPLMRYLVRLVTPPNGTILDPFCGSGSTGKAAMLEGFSFVGIDTDADYLEIARRRIEQAAAQPLLFALDAQEGGTYDRTRNAS